MKITKVEAIPLRCSYEVPIYDALFRARHRQAVLVRVETDAGIEGIGEAASFGGPEESTSTVIEREIGPRIIGEDPFDTERIWQKVYRQSWQHGRGGIVICALSGVDIALWDIVGKAVGTPLYKLLGGFTDRVPAYASTGFYWEGQSTEHLTDEVKKHVANGYTAVKVKVGRNDLSLSPVKLMPDADFTYTLEQDLERVTAVRSAIGSSTKLIVDANGAWDAQTALKMGRHFDDLDVFAFEEPVSTDNLEGSARLASALDLNVAGYESEQLAFNFKRLIDAEAVDIVQPDLTWAGGITESRRIAALAHAAHRGVMVHCFSSAITLAASTHFMCAIPNAMLLEIDQNPNGLRDEIIKNPLEVDNDGCVSPPKGPGLGVELDWDIVDKYRVRSVVRSLGD